MEPTPGYLVWRLANRWRVAVDRALAPAGLTHSQYVVLASLYGMEATTTSSEQRDPTGPSPLDPATSPRAEHRPPAKHASDTTTPAKQAPGTVSPTRREPVESSPTQRELADHTGLEALYVSKLARTLETRGLIERTRDAKDTRAVRLALTAEGREVIRPAIGTVRVLLDRLLQPLGGRSDPRAIAFTRDLTALLDTPLDLQDDPPPPGDQKDH
ncbi:hypothetical protein GCM10009677_01350 [Sphaerisporangium rubeum]